MQAWTAPAGLDRTQINAARGQSTSCLSTYLNSATYAASKVVDGVLSVQSASESFYNSQGSGPLEFWEVVRFPHTRGAGACRARTEGGAHPRLPLRARGGLAARRAACLC